MAFCLPSNLENFIPPPFEQRSQPPPWRGSFVVRGANSDRNITQKIFVTAVETDGEKASHWPETFYVRVVHERPVLQDIKAWVKESVPPLPICTFMPNRLQELNANAVNQTNFRSLSRILFENQAVAVAPWGTNLFPGAGIIIYPAQNSSAILVGALFFINEFPSLLDGVLSPGPHPSLSPSVMPVRSSRQAQYHHSVPHHNPNPNSPKQGSLANHGQLEDPYRYIMPHDGNLATYPDLGQGSSSSQATWSNKTEDENGYHVTYPPPH